MGSSCRGVRFYPHRPSSPGAGVNAPTYHRSPPDSALVGLNIPNIVMVALLSIFVVAADGPDNILTCSGRRQDSRMHGPTTAPTRLRLDVAGAPLLTLIPRL